MSNIYESPDGGKHVYKRQAGDYENKQLIIKEDAPTWDSVYEEYVQYFSMMYEEKKNPLAIMNWFKENYHPPVKK